MVRYLALACIFLAAVSCSGAPFVSRGSRSGRLAPGGGRFTSDGASTPNRPGLEDVMPLDDRELTTDDFDRIERLKENPVNPGEASLDALLAIPGFPEELGRRVVEAARETPSGKQLIDRLTPPEREEIYRYRAYLTLPEAQPARLNGRFTADRLVAGGGRREGSISLSAGGFKALWRGRFSRETNGAACYLSGQALSGVVRIHAGSFAPDFAMGLIFGGSAPSYLFSSSYPFRGERWIAGTTSCYGATVLGGAAELWYRRARAVVILGRLREFQSTHFELGKENIAGGRLAFKLDGGEIGFSGFGGACESGKALYSMDGSWRSDPLRFGFELGTGGDLAPGCLWGLSYGEGGTRAGFFLHSVPGSMAGPFNSVNGRALSARFRQSGAAAVLQHRLMQRFHVRIAFEHCARAGGSRNENRDVLKAEGEKKWEKAMLRLSWSSTVEGRGKSIPYPAESSTSIAETNSFGLYSTLRLSKSGIVKISIRVPRENDGTGLLLASVLSSSFISERLRTSICGTFYRVYEGRPVCYIYEPSLGGIYPWRAVSRSEESCAFLILLYYNELAVSSKIALQGGRPPETSFQVGLGF